MRYDAAMNEMDQIPAWIRGLIIIVALVLFCGFFIYHLGSTEQLHGARGPIYIEKEFELMGDDGGLI